MSKAVAERPPRADQLEGQYENWHVWTTRDGSPCATRTGNQEAPPGFARWARTLVTRDWPDLEAQLAEQQAIDEQAGHYR